MKNLPEKINDVSVLVKKDPFYIIHYPKKKMDFYNKTNNWNEMTQGKLEGHIKGRGFDVPFAVLPNQPEVTDTPEHLGPALEDVFRRLAKVAK